MDTCDYTPPILIIEDEDSSSDETVDMAEVYLKERVEKARNDPQKMALLSAQLYEEVHQMVQNGCDDRELMDAMEDEASRLAFCAATEKDAWCCAEQCAAVARAREYCLTRALARENRRKHREAEKLRLEKEAKRARKNWCCESKCFRVPRDQVDGVACSKCGSFGFCQCRCRTFLRNAEWAWCCPLRCILLAPFRTCLYLNCNRCNRLTATLMHDSCRSYSQYCVVYDSESKLSGLLLSDDDDL